MKAFDPRPYLKEIARGRHAARDLPRAETRLLFEAMLAGQVSDVALGALLVAWRVKGESLDELLGMMDALAGHMRPMRLPARRAIPAIVPSYNGARKLPNFVPLIASMLAREEVPVLVHGVAQEPSRVDTFQILERLGHAPVSTIADAEAVLDEKLIAAVPLAVLSPDLARIVDVRLETGVRNTGHTLAKLALPGGVAPATACRLVSVTHPDFVKLMRDYFVAMPGNAFVMRGVEGEPVVRLRSPQPMDEITADARLVTHLLPEGDAEYALPARDAEATARWTKDVLDGKIPPPATLARQVSLVIEHCRNGAANRRPLRLVTSKP